MYAISILCAVLVLTRSVLGEVFTAMADVEELLDSERKVVQTLDEFLIAEEERLQKIRK